MTTLVQCLPYVGYGVYVKHALSVLTHTHKESNIIIPILDMEETEVQEV